MQKKIEVEVKTLDDNYFFKLRKKGFNTLRK